MNDQMNAAEAIQTLIGGREVALPTSGKTVRVWVCPAKGLPSAIRFVSNLCTRLDIKLDGTGSASLQEAAKDAGFIMSVIADQGDELLALLPWVSSLRSQDIDTLPPDDLLVLISGAWEVNRDFFTQRVLPMVVRMLPVASAPG